MHRGLTPGRYLVCFASVRGGVLRLLHVVRAHSTLTPQVSTFSHNLAFRMRKHTIMRHASRSSKYPFHEQPLTDPTSMFFTSFFKWMFSQEEPSDTKLDDARACALASDNELLINTSLAILKVQVVRRRYAL